MTYPTRIRPRTAFSLPRELDRWMDQTLGSLQFGSGESLREWFPRTDVSETADHLTLRLEIPGIRREDLKISVENNMLTVRGEKKQETSSEDEIFYRGERAYGAFERSFSLPSPVNRDEVGASLQEGILTIRLPRREEAKAREIAIEGNGQEKRIEA
ncbi:Hsp20/alpha crystallin family protein [soil metagenome]